MDRGSLQHFNIDEIIYSIESVLPGSWFLGFPDFKLSPKYGYAPSGQFRRFGLNINEINTSRTRRLLYPSGLARAALEILGPYLNVVEIK